MTHPPTPMSYLGIAMRQARNHKHYAVAVLRCPICGRMKHPVLNANRGRPSRPCVGGAPADGRS